MTLHVPKGQDPQQGERECFFHPKLHMLRACHYEFGHRALAKNERTTVVHRMAEIQSGKRGIPVSTDIYGYDRSWEKALITCHELHITKG